MCRCFLTRTYFVEGVPLRGERNLVSDGRDDQPQKAVWVIRNAAFIQDRTLLHRLQTQDRAVGRRGAGDVAAILLCQHIKQAIRPLPDKPNSQVQLGKQRLPPQFFQVLIDHHAFQAPCARNFTPARAADEQ